MSAAVSLYRLPDGARQELEQLRQMATGFAEGAIPAARFQAFRVPLGVYEQRESGTYMLRVRLPAGMFLPDHMRAVADVSEKYGDGRLHLTTRQDIQIHGVVLDGLYPALTALADAGLSTKGGGGNTVRNIAACPHAGVCRDETFDVTPHVVAMTEFMLPDPLSFQLPRKYKLAFSGCGKDCAAATVSDLGFIAKRRDGLDGFAVYVGGGMGAQSRVSTPLEEFIPAGEACRVAEAVKRVFDKRGNRKNKHRARLRFLVEELGFDAFRELYRGELAGLREAAKDSPSSPAGEASELARHSDIKAMAASGFDRWRETSLSPQRQPGYYTVEISPALGIIDATKLRELADVVGAYGEGRLRATNTQSALLSWVPEEELAALYVILALLKLAEPPALRRLVACAGASTCRLGICLSRGLAKGILEEVERSGIAKQQGIRDLSINISGCPNSCGRHPAAQIGFSGAARRIAGHLVPHYVLHLGGHVEEGKTVLATGSKAIPARNIPKFLVGFLEAFRASSQYPDFAAYLAAGGRDEAERLADAHAQVPAFDEDKNHYFDWGAHEVFSLAGRGPGECGAGVFDLIEVDLATAAEALAAGRLFAATALAARALLVTRGEQSDTEAQSLALFRKHFLGDGLIAPELHSLIEEALGAAATEDPAKSFKALAESVGALLTAVRKLYEGMGPSLRVAAPSEKPPAPATAATLPAAAPDLTQDFRGVACPLNYVKTKMALGRLRPGQTLLVVLDEQGAKNVPASAVADGHAVQAVTPDSGHWRVVIRKGG